MTTKKWNQPKGKHISHMMYSIKPRGYTLYGNGNSIRTFRTKKQAEEYARIHAHKNKIDFYQIAAESSAD